MLYARLQLPLHIFEPRYRALVGDALARDRHDRHDPAAARRRCAGCIPSAALAASAMSRRWRTGATISCSKGCSASRVLRELDGDRRPSARSRANCGKRMAGETLSLDRARRDSRCEARRFADAQGYASTGIAVAQLDDFSLVNGVAQIAPFDAAAKQALLESPGRRRAQRTAYPADAVFRAARRLGRPGDFAITA
jgi:hypothetical protein